MGYWIRARDTSSTWSLSILLLVGALIAGLVGMHVLDAHGSPATDAGAIPHHAPSMGPLVGASVAASATGLPAVVGHGAAIGLPTAGGHGAAIGLPGTAEDAPTGLPITADRRAATGLPATVTHGAATVGSGHGCADCAEHAAMAEGCMLAPAAPAALPGPPAEDLRLVIAAPVVASAANDPADPRPPSISVLCISRR